MNANELQQQLFNAIKNRLPHLHSLVDEIATSLNVSTDSAYRRIRGEKLLTIEEVYTLCTKYNCPLDSLMGLQNSGYLFEGAIMQPSAFKFETYIAGIVKQVKYMNSFDKKKMYYLCKDIPIFHHYQFKEIAAFKYCFWMKTIMSMPQFVHKKISLADFPDEIYTIGKEALHYYNQLDSTELWNIESINSTLRQIEFYHDSNIFKSDEELFTVYEGLEKLMRHLELQANLGYKFDAADEERKPLGKFEMYFNEVITGDNSILAQLNESRIAFITHSGFNFMMTRNLDFCNNLHDYMHNLMKRSTIISSVSERERSRFFKNLRNRIEKRKQNIRA